MIAYLFAVAVTQAQGMSAAEPVRVDRVQNRLSIDPRIAPAVFPYFECVFSNLNRQAEARPIDSGEAAREANRSAIEACQTARRDAKTAATVLLSRSNLSNGARDVLVEQTLSSIDHANDHVAERLDVSGRK